MRHWILLLALISYSVGEDSIINLQSQITLNSSVHDLTVIRQTDCQTYKHPPKPHCWKQPPHTKVKAPVFLITWKLDSSKTTVTGFCYAAVNVTSTCDYRVLVYFVENIDSAVSVKWPWIEKPTLEELKDASHKGFLDPTPASICSWGRVRTTYNIRKRVYKCSIPTTASGISLDMNYGDCNLNEMKSCISLSNILTFVPDLPLPEFVPCPVSTDHFDLGVLEASHTNTTNELVTLPLRQSVYSFGQHQP